MKLFHLLTTKRNSQYKEHAKTAETRSNSVETSTDIEQELEKMSPEQRRFAEIMGTRSGFLDSIQNADDFGAVAHLGVLQSIKDPDIAFFKGMYHLFKKELSDAEAEFLSVSPDSHFHSEAIDDLLSIYVGTGQYWKLNDLLYKLPQESNMIKFSSRVICLAHMDTLELLNNKERILDMGFEYVEGFDKTDANMHSFFELYAQFSTCIVAANTIINECSVYQERYSKKSVDFAKDANLTKYIQMYDKLVFLLGLSKYFKPIVINSGNGTLADGALSQYSWEEKIQIIKSGEHHLQVAQTVLALCNPNLHFKESRIYILKHIAQLLKEINTRYIQFIINNEYDLLMEAACNGDQDVLQLYRIAYGDIVATNSDDYGLKDRLEQFLREKDDLELDKVVEMRKLVATLSIKAMKALIEVEQDYSVAEKQNRTKDESGVAQRYFRILEMEYNSKIIVPLVDNISIDTLKQICGFGKKASERSAYEIQMYERWREDIFALEKVKDGRQDTLELGTMRVLLDHILDDERHDACSRMLDNALTPLLSLDGLDAFRKRALTEVISKKNILEYRIPGSHTGYLPFSVAQEARSFLLQNLPIIETWFNMQS